MGFSPYEARAYVALVKHAPANGYEIAKAASIPTSKIYETLQRLQHRGAVRLFASDPVRYAATPADDLLATLRTRHEHSLNQVERGLGELFERDRDDTHMTWVLNGATNTLDAMRRAIERAENSLLAALWESESTELAPCLLAAQSRGVEVHLGCYGIPLQGITHCYDLSLCGVSAEERLGGRRLAAVVRDSSESVTAVFDAAGTAHGICTENAALGLLASEYIREEIMGRTIIEALGEQAYQKLRIDHPTLRALLRIRN